MYSEHNSESYLLPLSSLWTQTLTGALFSIVSMPWSKNDILHKEIARPIGCGVVERKRAGRRGCDTKVPLDPGQILVVSSQIFCIVP